MSNLKHLAHELDGVIADVEQGDGFDDVCLATIKRVRAAMAQADEVDPNAPWLSDAHALCADHGIPPGHIADRIKALREKLDMERQHQRANPAPECSNSRPQRAYRRAIPLSFVAFTNKMHLECLRALQSDAEGYEFEYTPYSGERPTA